MNEDFLSRARRFIQREIHKEGAYLLPLRLFIGIGWIRASMEKMLEPGWFNGAALTAFLDKQVSGGFVYFPFYQWLIEHVFRPSAQPLGLIIMLGQLLVGAAVLTGTLTNMALLCGLFMNLNFVLAGRVNPSAFYIIIQTVLFIANTGAILGVDEFLSRKVPFALLVAQSQFERKHLSIERASFAALVVVSALIAGFSIPYIRDFSPNSIDDPAMIMLVMSTLGGLSSLITYLRLSRDEVEGPTRPLARSAPAQAPAPQTAPPVTPAQPPAAAHPSSPAAWPARAGTAAASPAPASADLDKTLPESAGLAATIKGRVAPTAVLEVTDGPVRGKSFQVTEAGATIGRASDSSILLLDEELSRLHAKIEFKDGHYWLTDLGSTNGTFVNKARISLPRQLRSGDVIEFGKTRVVITLKTELAG